MKLWLKGAKQIVQVVKNGELYLTRDSMKSLAVLQAPDGEGLSVIVDDNGNILDFGLDSAMEAKYAKVVCDQIVDVSGNSIIPGEILIYIIFFRKTSIVIICFIHIC